MQSFIHKTRAVAKNILRMKIIAAEKDIKYDIEMASQNLYLLDRWEQAHLVIQRANIYTSICVRVSMCHCNNVHPHTGIYIGALND